MSRSLRSKLAQVRRRQWLVRAGTGLSLTLMLLVVGLSLTMTIDWWFELAQLWRAATLALLGAAVLWMLGRYALLPIIRASDDDELALQIERRDERFQGRLISAVQLARGAGLAPGTSPSLTQALIRQTEAIASAVNFRAFVRTRPVKQLAVVTASLLLLASGGFLMAQPASEVLLQRVMLAELPVPRKTRVIDITGDLVVARGDDVRVAAQARGIRPLEGGVQTSAPHASQTYDMPRDGAIRGQYAVTIHNVQETFVYRIWLNDGHGEPHTVRVIDRPNVEQLVCIVRYPPYTHLMSVSRPASDLTMLAGSGLDLIVIADQPLRAGANTSVELSPGGTTFPLRVLHAHTAGATAALHVAANALADQSHITDADRSAYIAQIEQRFADRDLAITGHDRTDPADPKTHLSGIPLPVGTQGFRIHLLNTYDIANHNPALHGVELLPAHPPRVEIVGRSHQEGLVTRQAQVQVQFAASDDFGLSRLAVRYRVGGGDVQEVPIPLDLPTASATQSFDWSLAALPVSTLPIPAEPLPAQHQDDTRGDAAGQTASDVQRETIEFWMHAENANNVTSRNGQFDESDSDHYLIRVVTPQEKARELLARIGTIPLQVEPLLEQQAQISQALGERVTHGE